MSNIMILNVKCDVDLEYKTLYGSLYTSVYQTCILSTLNVYREVTQNGMA